MNPGTEQALARGKLLFQQGRYEQALRECQKELAADPRNVAALALISLCQAHLDQFPPARQTAMDAIALEPDNAEGHYVLAWALHSDARFVSRRPGEVPLGAPPHDRRRIRLRLAGAAVAEALRIAPRETRFLVLKSQISLSAFQFKDALQAANAALAANPGSADALRMRAMILRFYGDPTGATDAASQALALEPTSARSHCVAGWTALSAGSYPAACGHFLETLRIDAVFPGARAGLLESLRAHYWFYRPVLRLSLFFKRNARSPLVRTVMVILGIVVVNAIFYGMGAFDFISSVGSGDRTHPAWSANFHPCIVAVGGIALLFLPVTVMCATGAADFLLLLHPLGRDLLMRRQRVLAILGTSLACSLVLCLLMHPWMPDLAPRAFACFGLLVLLATGCILFVVVEIARRRTFLILKTRETSAQ